MVASNGAFVPFVAVNNGRLLFPDAPRPMAGIEFTHENAVPLTGPVKVTAAAVAPLQYEILEMGSTEGVGFTVIVNETGLPGQVLAVGVTVTVETTGEVPLLCPVKEAIVPVPLLPSPIVVLLLLQEYAVPVTEPLKLIALTVLELHTSCPETGFTVGVGFTLIVNVFTGPLHPLAVGVTEIVAVIGVFPVFNTWNGRISPDPLEPRPILVDVLVQA